MNSRIKYVTLICSILILISFFLPWIQTNDMVSFFSGGEKISLSGFDLIEYANKIDRLINRFTGESPWQLKLVGLYFLIPLSCIFSITFMFFKKQKLHKMISVIGFSVVIILCLLSLIILKSDSDLEMLMEAITGVGIGYILTIIGAIVGLISAFIIPVDKMNVDSEIDSLDKKREIGSENILSEESREKINKQFKKFQNVSSKLIINGIYNLSKSSFMQIGYLVFVGIMFIMTIIQLSNEIWTQTIQGVLLISLAILMYFKMRYKLNDESVSELYGVFKQIKKFINSLNISDNFINSLDKLIYLFVGILLLNQFVDYGSNLGVLVSMLSNLSGYALFVSIILLLSTDKEQLAFNGVVGYLTVMIVNLLRIGLFSPYKYISFYISLKVLIYWTITCYLLEYVKQVSEINNSYNVEDIDEKIIEDTLEIK